MTDQDILKRLLELGVEKLLEANPDFVLDKPTIVSGQTSPQASGQTTPPKEAVVKPGKTDNPNEDAEWQRRFGK